MAEGTGEDFYFSESTMVTTLLKPKKEDSFDIDIDIEKYEKTRVKRKTLHYVIKQD